MAAIDTSHGTNRIPLQFNLRAIFAWTALVAAILAIGQNARMTDGAAAWGVLVCISGGFGCYFLPAPASIRTGAAYVGLATIAVFATLLDLFFAAVVDATTALTAFSFGLA